MIFEDPDGSKKSAHGRDHHGFAATNGDVDMVSEPEENDNEEEEDSDDGRPLPPLPLPKVSWTVTTVARTILSTQLSKPFSERKVLFVFPTNGYR